MPQTELKTPASVYVITGLIFVLTFLSFIAFSYFLLFWEPPGSASSDTDRCYEDCDLVRLSCYQEEIDRDLAYRAMNDLCLNECKYCHTGVSCVMDCVVNDCLPSLRKELTPN